MNANRKDFSAIKFVRSKSVVNAVIKEAQEFRADLIIVGAAWPRFLQTIHFSHISEAIAKNAETSVLMIKGHGGVAEVFWKNLLNKLNPGNRI